MADWTLAQLKPNADAMAKRNLERQGFMTFQPLERCTVRRNGRFLLKTRPFFPGYLFVSYPAQASPWSVINSTYGVAQLVKFGERPAVVPNSIIHELRVACDANGIIMPNKGLTSGAEVEIQSGYFANFIGTVERLAPNDRAYVLLNFMGTSTKVSLSVAHLRVASGRVI